jgi:sec-independent protein translocase protein TatA
MFEGIFQPMHLLFVLVVALIVFGPDRLPELGAGLGKFIREFRKAVADGGAEHPRPGHCGTEAPAGARGRTLTGRGEPAKKA